MQNIFALISLQYMHMKIQELLLLVLFIISGQSQFGIQLPIPLTLLTFQQYKDKYSKTYANPGVQKYRQIVFNNNKNLINEHNQIFEGLSYVMEENQFMDLTEAQFMAFYTGLIPEDQQTTRQVQNIWKIIEYDKRKENCDCQADPADRNLIQQSIQDNRDEVGSKIDSVLDRNVGERLKKNQTQELAQNLTESMRNKTFIMRRYIEDPSIILQNVQNGSPGSQSVQIFMPGNGNVIIPGLPSNPFPPQPINQTPSTLPFEFPQSTSPPIIPPQIPNPIFFPQTPTPQGEFIGEGGNGGGGFIGQIGGGGGFGPARLLQSTLKDVDWQQYCGDVRNQSTCGSCYAFSSVNNVQSIYSIFSMGGIHIQLSVQQMIDCQVNFNGCLGGLLSQSFEFLRVNGVTLDFNYPYIGKYRGQCPVDLTTRFNINRYRIIRNDCNALNQNLIGRPITVSIDARKMKQYGYGVFNDCSPNPMLNHAVLLVGYKQSQGWRIKNSWGHIWGQDGYMWISSFLDCGICQFAIAPFIQEQPQVTEG